MEVEELKAEVARLRSEVEAYKQREVEDLKTRLAAAEQATERLKAEAEYNAVQARKMYSIYIEETSRLKAAIAGHQQIPNTRAPSNGR